jgi:hypothetical protein
LSFGLLCINPGYIFSKLVYEEKPRSVILASGTLSALNHKELNIEFPIKLENQHALDPERIFARIIKQDL